MVSAMSDAVNVFPQHKTAARRFKVTGLDCQNEVRALKAAVDPVFAWQDNEVAARAMAASRAGAGDAESGFGSRRA